MDAAVFFQGSGIWQVNATPSMRSIGEVTQGSGKTFLVSSDTEAYALDGIHSGPYTSLEKAQQAIAEHLGGLCRVAPPRNFR